MPKFRQHLSAWQVVADNFMLFFIWAIVLVALLLVFFHIKAVQDKDYHPKAEFMIVLDYDDHRNIDLDLWLKPLNNHKTVFYRNRETDNISLDRDTRGRISNLSKGPDGQEILSGNEEIITIRAVVPGTYEVAVTYYSDAPVNNTTAGISQKVRDKDDPSADYKVKLIKVNPKLTVVWEETRTIHQVKEIQKVVTFRLDPDGSMNVVPNDPEPFLPEGSIP